jgi:hypothetical protein
MLFLFHKQELHNLKVNENRCVILTSYIIFVNSLPNVMPDLKSYKRTLNKPC